MTLNCPACHATNLRSAKVCSHCGGNLGESAKASGAAGSAGPARQTGAAAPADKTVLYASKPAGAPSVRFKVRRSNLGGVSQAEYTVARPSTIIGRSDGDWVCPDDGRMSRRHSELTLEGKHLYLADLGSTNGTYVRLPSRYRLSKGDCVLIGNELFQVNSASAKQSDETEGTLLFGEDIPKSDLTLVDPRGPVIQEVVFKKDRTVVGRGAADLSFPQDAGLSEQHAAFVQLPQGLYLEDLGSARGTYIRIKDRRELREGDKFLVGEQVFHIFGVG